MGIVGSGSHSTALTSLQLGRPYYFRTMATNGAATVISSELGVFIPAHPDAGSFLPTSAISADLEVWFDANDSSTLTLGSPVTTGWSAQALTGDSDSGVSSSDQFTCAVNVNGSNKTVNGVTFTGSSATSGTGWALTAGFTNPHGGTSTSVGGGVGGVLSNGFRFAGDPQKLKLTGLTNGQTYTLTLYSQGWGNGGRWVDISGTDLNSFITVDQDIYGSTTDGLIVTCTYVADGTEAEFTFDPHDGGNTWHLYGFSNRVGASGTVTNTERSVTRWNDKSANERNATSPVGAPALSSNTGPGGNPVLQIRRAGGNDSLSIGGSAFFAKEQFYVFRSE